ncbi:MAG TPA: heme lyase CcmF/NrfE family subunit [Rhodocyclaceae bacterium]|nr:heme lyase CcmF/NrfE family subunit [Rhodocyclaceae bacterium]
MIPELGHLALILAWAVSLVLGTLPLIGAQRGRGEWIALARPSAQAVALLVMGAFAALAWAFMSNDFSVAYVAQNSNSLLPALYRFGAVWGGHEGSLLLWAAMLVLWMLAVSVFSKGLPDVFVARVLGVLGLVAAGFLLFILLTSNPFERLLPAPDNGRDLNPMLQDPGLVFHPPMLYMGYVGFSVAFAFALAALMNGRFDAAWARWTRPWTIAAWVSLTLGIAMGSRWAYYVLGWGGWWFWDPVENASFMPWLAGTALMHSLAVTEKRGTFRAWTVLLAIAAFSLSLLGTFLVRSGVLSSVHAFATDPRRGLFILAFLAFVVGGSLGLFALRAPRLKADAGRGFGLLSREALLLANNVLFAVATATVLLGTLYPLIIDALDLGKLSVGPPYFNAVFVPVMVPLLLLISVGTAAGWGNAHAKELARRLGLAAGLALVAGIAAPLLLGDWSPLTALGMVLAFWIIAGIALQVRERLRILRPGLAWWGMQLAHVGVAVFVIGVTLVMGFETEKNVRMAPGDTTSLGAYSFRFQGVREVPGPNYTAVVGDVELLRGDELVQTLHPEKRIYFSSSNPMTDAAIRAGLTRDLYVSLGEPLDGGADGYLHGAWSVRVYDKPFVNWIWGGCLFMALGGLTAMADRRYRRRTSAVAQNAALQGAV